MSNLSLVLSIISLFNYTIHLCEASKTFPSEDGVYILTDSNYDDFIVSNPVVMVEFYAPWCGYCKQLSPEYAKAASLLKEKSVPAVLAKLDSTVNQKTSASNNIDSYPTLKFFKHGTELPYTGAREAEAIVDWIQEMLLPPTVELEADQPLPDAAIVYLLEYVDKEGEFYKTFVSVAEKHRTFGKFFTKAAAADSLTVHRKDEEPITFNAQVDAIEQFILDESFPLFGQISSDNYMKYVESKKNLTWFCGTRAHYDQFKAVLTEVAKKQREETLIIWLDTDEFPSVPQAFLLDSIPGLAHLNSNGRYLLKNENNELESVEVVNKFYADVAEGKISKSVKSEPVPEENNDPIKVVVGLNLEEFLFQADKDVMLLIYSPRCAYCKKMEPEFEAFAERVKSEPGVLVGKFNGDVNESPIPEVTWEGLPTIIFATAGSRKVEQFEGERTADEFYKFVSQRVTTPLVGTTKKDEEL